jgi:hypothetical protein
MNIPGFGSRKAGRAIYSTPDDRRPVRLLRLRENVWQVVYAD